MVSVLPHLVFQRFDDRLFFGLYIYFLQDQIVVLQELMFSFQQSGWFSFSTLSRLAAQHERQGLEKEKAMKTW
jgi:hypothetical protein